MSFLSHLLFSWTFSFLPFPYFVEENPKFSQATYQPLHDLILCKMPSFAWEQILNGKLVPAPLCIFRDQSALASEAEVLVVVSTSI
jgi:hypothetical protein